MSLTAQARWLITGSKNTTAALERLGNDLRDLQNKVESINLRLAQVEQAAAAGRDRAELEQLDASMAAMREQLRVVTDDLGDRVGAVSELLNAPQLGALNDR